MQCYHSDAQCRVRELPALYDAWVDLYAATWAAAEGLYAHPFGPFDPTRLVFYYDRLCHRWPDRVFAMRAALPAAFGGAQPSAAAADSAGPTPGKRRRTWKASVEDDTPPTGPAQKGTGRDCGARSARGPACAHSPGATQRLRAAAGAQGRMRTGTFGRLLPKSAASSPTATRCRSSDPSSVSSS